MDLFIAEYFATVQRFGLDVQQSLVYAQLGIIVFP